MYGEQVGKSGLSALRSFRAMRVTKVAKVLRMLRALKALRLLRFLVPIQQLIQLIVDTFSYVAWVWALLLACVFFFALLGMQLFGESRFLLNTELSSQKCPCNISG